MKTIIKKIFVKILYAYYSLIFFNKKSIINRIFIIGHMRSGSSLLVQLLRNNKEILGFGESHLIYSRPIIIDHLYYKSSFYNNIFLPLRKHKFVLDKILHSHYLPESNWYYIQKYNVKIIFLFREPSGAINSLQKSLGLDIDKSIKHYTGRLNYIADLSSYLDERNIDYHTLTYNELINNPDVELQKLKEFLHLETNLDRKYKIQHTTGKKGFGDFSPNILSGEILKKKNINNNHVPAHLNEIYDKILHQLT